MSQLPLALFGLFSLLLFLPYLAGFEVVQLFCTITQHVLLIARLTLYRAWFTAIRIYLSLTQ